MPVYVQREVLGKVNDVFDAEAIWRTPGLALFARRPLLRDLLERSPREHRGKAPTRCFSHVTVLLPQEEVDDDRHLTRGARARDLTETLRALHQKDFGDLLGNDEVRYDVVGADDLAPGEVEVRFGHAVYLPAPGEKILYQVTASRDSAIWKPVCGIYPNQRLALIGHDPDHASQVVPGWPFGDSGGILLINDGPDAPVEVQARPRDLLECSYDPLGGCYTIKSRADGQKLFLRVARIGSPAGETAGTSKPAAVWKSRSAGIDLTAAPGSRPASDATFAPVARQRVSLAAIALPRLSRYRDTGARGLELGFDRQSGVVAPDEAAMIRFGVDDQDQVFAATAEGMQAVTVPGVFTPADGIRIALHAAPAQVADRYAALIDLPQARSLGCPAGARLVFGRSAPALAELRVLDRAAFLRGGDGASADRIGLSRQAFSFEAGADGYAVTRLSATQALYHLDEQLQYVATITGDQPYRLPSGHHLLAGHYVLRFHA
jgi:hypothetical protein